MSIALIADEAGTEAEAKAKVEAKAIVDLIRAQNRGGALLVGEVDAVALLATALRVAEQRGVIDGINRIGVAADKAAAGRP
jgi:hypothetical protein